jgi:hypothetical protein
VVEDVVAAVDAILARHNLQWGTASMTMIEIYINLQSTNKSFLLFHCLTSFRLWQSLDVETWHLEPLEPRI